MNTHVKSRHRWRSAGVILIGTALLLVGLLAPSAQARTEAFQSLASSPVDLTSVAADPVTGDVYAQENGGTKFFVYDPRTDLWTELAPSPLSSGNNGGATYLGGKIYASYTSNGTELAVYDIASGTWTTIANPLEEGTADITAGNGKLYMAVEESFISYDPATAITTPLAEPPIFEEECEEGFSQWGGLQFTGTKIYGHQGDGCRGFGVYDIAGNSWTELPPAPQYEGKEEEEEGGPVAGSAYNPVTNTYLTYGSYGGDLLYRFDIDAGSWSTTPLPFAEEVDDGGLAYVGVTGYEGVYAIQGEAGIEFTRYTERTEADVATSMSAKVLGSATGGEITYSVQVKNNGPEKASAVALSDPLPAGTKLVSVASSLGTCTGTTTVSCSLGILTSGTTASLTIKVTSGFGTVSNTATSSTKSLDKNPSNDSATVVSTLAPPAQPVKPVTAGCFVRKLRSRSLKGAKHALRAAHCKPGKLTRIHGDKITKGRVIRGAKHRGTVLPAGSKVNITVSLGRKH